MTVSDDAVTTNYNEIGTIIMEMIYADDYLSPGGAATTDALSTLAGLADGSAVLDVGSGLGGAAFRLATRHECLVTGVDIIEQNVHEAKRRSQARDLAGRVAFVAGDATALPFDDIAFDVVYGQDAWCHVTDKERLINEAHRVLRSGGKIVFSDWLLRDATHTRADEVREVTASPNIGTADKYRALLRTAGFELGYAEETSEAYASRYRHVMERLLACEAEVRSRFGDKVFDIVVNKQQFVHDVFSTGILGAAYFVARKV